MKEKQRMLKLMYKRKEKKLTQNELGAKVGVIGKTIHLYEVGERQPSPIMLRTLADALDCTIDDIV